MRSVILAVFLLLVSADVAMARCSDDAADFNARIDHDLKIKPSPQVSAAAKVMQKLNENIKNMDEVDCYNALARARRALKTAPPPEAAAER